MKPSKQARLQAGLVGVGLLPALHAAYQGVQTLRRCGPGLGPHPLERLAQISGSWALYFLLLSLAITPLRRLLRAAWLVRARRTLGLLSFFYASQHAVTWLLGRAVDPVQRIGPSILSDISQRPYVTLGALAFVALVPLAVTSTRAMVRRLGRRWQHLHRLVYGAAFLAVMHFTWQAKQDAWRAFLCAGLWLLGMALRLIFWARDLRTSLSPDSDES